MKKFRTSFLYDILISITVLLFSFIVSLCLDSIFKTQAMISTLFVLAVFLISLLTQGYIYGIVSAVVSVLAVNFAFTFPYFELNFRIYENFVSAIIMIVITTTTSTLITKLKHQEKIKLESEKEKMRADLLRAISHDLRTPLTAIYGASSTVMENYNILSDSVKLDILNGIKEDSQWLIRMVENLLSVTKIDNSNVKLIKSSVVPEELIDSVIAKFRKRYPEQNVEISMPDEFISVSADPILIEQVLVNLLENAVQHASGMTKLILNVYTEDFQAVFEVIDNGCGIEKEKLKNIFSGGSIANTLPADAHKRCMGIGLSVCAAIINAHGGNITAKYNRKKGEMIFRFTLKLEDSYNE